MCKCLPKNTVIKIGLFLTFLIGVLSISPIFFSRFEYRQTHLNWIKEGPWTALGAAQISSVVVLFASFILGIMTFGICIQSKGLQLFFVVFELLSTIISFSIGVYCLVASQISNNELTQTCQIDYKGMFDNFRYLDELFHKADFILCSSDCPCNITNDLTLEEFQQTEKFYNEYKEYKIDSNSTIKSIQQCQNIDDIITVSKQTNFTDNIGYITEDIFRKDFATYWKRIEEKFDCVGWCEGAYFDSISSKNRFMYKYLFSDVNRGVPKRRCMNPFKNWMVRMLKAFGSLILIDSILQATIFVFAVTLFCFLSFKEDSNIIINEKNKQINNIEVNKV